jgi:hypothetical protein
MKAALARHDEILRAAVETRTTKMFRDKGRLKRAVVLAKGESWEP